MMNDFSEPVELLTAALQASRSAPIFCNNSRVISKLGRYCLISQLSKELARVSREIWPWPGIFLRHSGCMAVLKPEERLRNTPN